VDVRLDDGTIVRGVPDGTTRSQLMAKLAKNGHAPVDRSGVAGTLDAGVRGATDMATFGLADKIVAGLNSIIPLDKATNPNIKSVWETGDIGGAFRNNLQQEQQIAATDQAQHSTARAVGQVAGAIAGPVPGRGILAAGASAAAKRAVRAGVGSTIARTTAGAARIAGEGAIQSGLHGIGQGDSTSIGDRLAEGGNEAAQGGLGALIGAGVMRGAGRAISPIVDPAVAKLAAMGVVMTPGQRAGRGLTQFVENAVESVPGLGVAIRGAKRRGIEQFNRGAINEALKPIGAVLPKKAEAGRTAIEAAQEVISNNYDDALSKVRAPVDAVFQSDLAATAQNAANLPPEQAKAFDFIMQNKIAPLLQGGQLDGSMLQDVTRTLQRVAADAKKTPVAGEFLADALSEVRQHFIDLAGRYSPEGTAGFLKANQAEANMSRIYDAASKAHGDGVFTPQQLATAVAKRGYGTTTKNAAAGNARMQDVADAAKSILPNTLPNSGTAERAAVLGGIGAGASGGLGALVNPAFALPIAGVAPYVPGIDRALQAFALRGQGKGAKALAKEIRKRAYVGGMIGAPVALNVGDR
jgi:hypothetical protein